MTIGKHLAVSACGASGLAFTVFIIVLVNHLTGFNLFALNVYAIVPVGGMIAGFAAASGYYFSCIGFSVRPNVAVLAQIILASALAQILVYYAEFRWMSFDDGTALSTVMSFSGYMKAYLQALHIYGGRHLRDLGPMQGAGWWFAGIEYLGFLMGGLVVYLALKAHPVCRTCNCYLKQLASKHQYFSDSDTFAMQYQTLPDLAENVEALTSLLALSPSRDAQEPGDIKLTTTLYGCSRCKGERLEQRVRIHTEKGWRTADDQARQFDLPEGASVRACFD